MPDLFQVDVAQLNKYLTQETPLSAPSKRAVLQTAYEAFLAAGVFKYYNRPAALSGTISVEKTGVVLKYGGKTLYWTEDRIPPVDALIAGLAYHLATVLNEAPTPGPWPKQLDEAD